MAKTSTLEAKLAAKLGVAIEEFKDDTRDDMMLASREAEGVLLFLQQPQKFKVSKFCDGCGGLFLSSISAVACCSDRCRRECLRKIGIEWSKDKTQEERWGSTGIPLIIPPAALVVIRQLVQELPQLEHLNGQAQDLPAEDYVELFDYSEDETNHSTMDEDDMFLQQLLES